MSDDEYQAHVLQGVSRTFALSIPQLPPPLRRSVGNAYLLCRIADTIEDDPGMSFEEKRGLSRRLIEVVAGRATPEPFAAELVQRLSPHTNAAERDLVRHTPRVIRITRSLPPRQRAAMLHCVTVMANGMTHFQHNKSLDGLEDLGELDSYCYHVAGVVGEMLTELYCDYSEEIGRNRDPMLALAASFGQGLQMTNILKDIWEDRARGACWLPRELFREHGLDLRKLSPEGCDPAFGEGLERLIAIAHRHLRSALAYTLLIPRREAGIRKFCLWALGMAVLTLRKIHRRRAFVSSRQVKISRRSVLAVVLVTRLTARSDWALRALFAIAARGLPRAEATAGTDGERVRPYPLN
jgi:farnesyl-diphosphate farnesyltransferase